MAGLPLEGVRIIDLSVVWAGPMYTMQLAALGAELILVESTSYSFTRRRGIPYPSQQYLERTGGWPWLKQGKGLKRLFNKYAYFNYFYRSRLSMTVDLARAEGQEALKRLVKISDGVVENQHGRRMEQFGLDYDDLIKVNPEIIMVRMPGFGLTGPDKYRPAYGYTMDAIAGHTSLRHYPDEDPITSSCFHGDASSGAMAAAAFLTALHYRDVTGKGQLIDISQSEIIAGTCFSAFLDYFMNGRVQGTIGNRDTTMAPQNCYPCRSNQELSTGSEDTWWTLSIENDEQWRTLCQVMSKPELADDPRFADAISRKRNEELIDPIIIEWAADKDQYQIMDLLQAEGIPAGPVIDAPDVMHDRHVEARGHMVPIEHPEAGTHFYPGPFYKLSETPCQMGPAPLLGQHNDYVYKELLGYSDEEIQRLTDEKHIGMDYLPDAK